MEAQTHEPQMGLTFEKVWAMFQESGEKFDRKMRESREITEREMRELRESQRKTDRLIEETARQMRETDKRIGNLGNSFGKLSEHLVLPNLADKFNALGYKFTEATPNASFMNDKGETIAEVDALLRNSNVVLAVEVKTTAREEHVRDHIERMEILRRYADEHGDERKHIGGIAGVIMSEDVKKYALNSGFYVIEPSGDTVRIAVPEGFKPKEW